MYAVCLTVLFVQQKMEKMGIARKATFCNIQYSTWLNFGLNNSRNHLP